MRFSLTIGIVLVAVAQPLYAATDTALLRVQEGTAALMRGNFDQAVTSYDEALKDADLPAARLAGIHNDRGVALWRLKRLDDALKDFTRSIELFDGSASTYNNRANVYIDLGKYEEALADLNRAITLAPGYGAAYNNRGNAKFQLGRHEEALVDYRRATELMPTNAVPYNGRAQVQEMIGRPYAGLRYVTRAISLNGKYMAAYRNRALINQRLEREEQALADYERLLTLAPEDADLYVGRGQVHLERGKTLSAVKDFDKAIELDPQNPQAYIGRGATQIARKRYGEALADLDQAITLDTGLAEAYYRRAEAHFHLDDLVRAEADIAKALEITPNYAEVYRVKGRIAEAQQNNEAAIAAYRQALQFDPFIKDVAGVLKKLSGEGEDEQPVKPIAEAVQGWEIISPYARRFVAVNSTYPNLKILLEMHGEGQPEILEWTPLSDFLRGFGLLRYSAGRLPNTPADAVENNRYEFVAIVDVNRQNVVSIEPYLAGTEKAKWDWTKTSVVVTDVDGVISAHELREPPKPKPEPRPVQRERQWYDEDNYGGRRRNRGLFDWLFN
ncbi:MAG: tetratricopeptide repeat protein [Rhodomicrobiaceae bacterium]